MLRVAPRASLAISLVAVVGCAREPQFTYTYQRPPALGRLPDSIALAVPSIALKDAADAGERKARRLAEVLGIRLDSRSLSRQLDEPGEVLRVKDSRHRLKVYVPSGMVRFRDTKLYNQTLAEERGLPALSAAQAVERAKDVLTRLARAGLVAEDQLLVEAAHISFRKEAGNPGAARGQRGRPQVEPDQVADTRVFVPRAIAGVGVSGHGVGIVFTKRGQVAGLDLLWRDLDVEKQPLRTALSMSDAVQQFQRAIDLPSGSLVDVSVNDLVYYDPSMRDPVAFLEPAYLFVYRVRVPIGGRDEFNVSKLLHHVIPAVTHGRTQLIPPRRQRFKELLQRVDTVRPTRPPAAPSTEDDTVPPAPRKS